jgi:hypothetical protein
MIAQHRDCGDEFVISRRAAGPPKCLEDRPQRLRTIRALTGSGTVLKVPPQNRKHRWHSPHSDAE